MPRIAFGILLGIALAVWLWLVPSALPRAALPTSGATVIAFGDSLVEGRGASRGQDFVSVLSSRTGIRIVNAGRSGDTTGSALARLDADVLARDPRIVIVVLGGNDYLRRIPADTAFENLGTIVERIRRRGAAVILVGVSVGLLSDPYAQRYEALAWRTSSGYVPDILDGLIGRSSMMADGIHPNDRGYAAIAGRLEPLLRELVGAE
jgi:lysophospholipase L1-like esterase